MKRTQLNVSIDPKLLEKIKESARLSGKSLVGYVSDCFVNQIENIPVESIDSRFQMIEQRIHAIEKNIQLINPQTQTTPSFTSKELKNFNEFVKAVFKKESKRKGYKTIKEAWNDFINHINCFTICL